MRYLTTLVSLVVALTAWSAYGQPSTYGLPPACSITTDPTLSTSCVPQLEGMRARVTDGADSTDCTVGGGTDVHVCVYEGSTWVAEPTVASPTHTGTATFSDITADSITMDASATPTLSYQDSDCPGTDKDVAWIEAGYDAAGGGDGAEDADLWIEVIQGGAENTEVLRFDESDDNWETTRSVMSPVFVSLHTAATYVVGTNSSHEAYGGVFVNNDNDAITFTLPTGVVGMHMTFVNGNAAGTTVTGAITVDSVGTDAFVLVGVAGVAAEEIHSAGAAGDQVEVLFIGNGQWLVLEATGTWAHEA